jgi:Ca2+-binding EF-hand superfamily protein
MGDWVSEEDISNVIRSVDHDGNGMIDYGEFTEVVMTDMKQGNAIETNKAKLPPVH